MSKVYKQCPEDAVYQTSEYFDCQFMSSPNFTPFCSLLSPNRCQPLDFF